MPRYKLTVAYDGTDFHGWQKQEPPDAPPLRTVQGVLETTVREVVRQPIILTGASRTDAGVHALGQCAAFSADTTIPLDRLPRAINSRLPDDLQIHDAVIVPDAFDPIADCLAKAYRYTIAHGGEPGSPHNWLAPLFDRRIVYWTCHQLSAARMHAAAQHLVGEHDFASFAQINHGRETTIRTILSCTVQSTHDNRCEIEVSGTGFLYNMVRIIAGTLVEVGRGKYEPEDLPRIIAACDRRAAGPTLPPEGLCLLWTRYPDTKPV